MAVFPFSYTNNTLFYRRAESGLDAGNQYEYGPLVLINVVSLSFIVGYSV